MCTLSCVRVPEREERSETTSVEHGVESDVAWGRHQSRCTAAAYTTHQHTHARTHHTHMHTHTTLTYMHTHTHTHTHAHQSRCTRGVETKGGNGSGSQAVRLCVCVRVCVWQWLRVASCTSSDPFLAVPPHFLLSLSLYLWYSRITFGIHFPSLALSRSLARTRAFFSCACVGTSGRGARSRGARPRMVCATVASRFQNV